MNIGKSVGKINGGAYLNKSLLFLVIGSILFASSSLQAQKKVRPRKPLNDLSNSYSTNNKFIWANVDAATGSVNVLLPPGRGDSPSLDFPDHSYFTAQIDGTIFTNNSTIDLPPNAFFLVGGNTVKIADTVRTTWFNKNGVDIIQDIYPVLFPKSGQIVYKWKFHNLNGSPAIVACQYLQDIEITDPSDQSKNQSNDGPIVLTKWAYQPRWLQYPNVLDSEGVPPFYIGFLHDLPNAPNYYPNLSSMGYLDYPDAPLSLIKPAQFTIGDWYIMTQTIFGTSRSWPMAAPYGTSSQVDNALLIEFSQQGVPAFSTVVVGKTSYGTGEYETCNGRFSSVLFYPHHLVWTKSNNPPPGYYTPNPVHIEKYIVNSPDSIAANHIKIRLNVGDDMTISDSLCNANFGTSEEQPSSGLGLNLGPGDVGYVDWWACVKPALFCTGADIDSLIFTGSSTAEQAPFETIQGVPECDQLITIDCAEADQDPPLFADTEFDCHSTNLTVSDSRPTDRGLQSITWVAEKGTDTSKIIVSAPFPAITPCYYDTLKHVISITKTDSTAKGCIDFTFTDCLGHQSYHTVCLKPCIVTPHPDSLPPVFTLLIKSGAYDSIYTCSNGIGGNSRLDSFVVTDNNGNDSGVCMLDTLPGVQNMKFSKTPFRPGDPLVRFSVTVIDSMLEGNICIQATDCSKEAHTSSTCIHYCPIKDTLAPRIRINKDAQFSGLWHVDVYDDTDWDSHLDTIFVRTTTPGNISPAVITSVRGLPSKSFDITSDSTQLSQFCIEAWDIAGNKSIPGTVCANGTLDTDALCPNIIITPPLNTNPATIWVTVNDIHYDDPPKNSIKYVWDTGVDSVWFTYNSGMKVPGPISGNGKKQLDSFQISVLDSTKIDTVACVTINASDRQGNICSEGYCYPYTQDTLPPVITLWYNPADKSQIFGVITDSLVFDRGLDSLALFHSIGGVDTNLYWSNVLVASKKVYSIDTTNPITRNPLQSSTGAFWARDRWGTTFLPYAPQHTALVDFAIWVQAFKMKAGLQPKQGTSFSIPVYFVKNDTLPVIRKGITDFAIDFTLTGDTASVVFDGPSMAGTEMQLANWNTPQWNGNPSGTHIHVTGSMGPNGNPLASVQLDTLPVLAVADSLVILNFHSVADASTREVKIRIDSIVLNQGKDVLYTGTKSAMGVSTALMPAPQSSLTGSTIVITGACSPELLSDNLHPTSVSLDPPHPNPFSHTTAFDYTIADDGPVKLAVYDMLGQEIKILVNESQKQGHYTVMFDGSKVGSGNYIVRLAAGGTICSRTIGIEK